MCVFVITNNFISNITSYIYTVYIHSENPTQADPKQVSEITHKVFAPKMMFELEPVMAAPPKQLWFPCGCSFEQPSEKDGTKS